MEKKLIKIASIIFEVPESHINQNSNPASIESWDSMNHMNFILALEEEFKIKIPDEIAIDLLSIEAIANFLESKNHDHISN